MRLVAHLEPVPGATLDTDELRRTLHRQLPAHLVPSIFVHHDALPLNDRGKIDRQALTAAPVVPWRARPARLPAGEVETVVTGIVTDVPDVISAALAG